MSKKHTFNMLGDTPPTFNIDSNFLTFDDDERKLSKKWKKKEKKLRAKEKKLKKARKKLKQQQKALAQLPNSSARTWWQDAIVESLPRLIDLIDSSTAKKR